MAQQYNATMMPALQATAATASAWFSAGQEAAQGLGPGVNGWYRANWRRPSGMVLAGTNPLRAHEFFATAQG
jgi:hypothetical protein